MGNKYYKRELILHFDKQNGYFCTKLFNNKSKKYKYIHRLVAENFIKNDNNCKNVIDHIDANKLNNRIDNLEWVTSKENNRRAREMGLTKFSQETINKLKQNAIKNNSARFLLPYAELRKRKIYQYDLNDNFIAFYESIDEAKKIYGKSAHIVDCCQGKRKQSKGYKWRYANEDNN